ncbi:MAG: hypothetical protein GX786_03010, partial [Clostridiales bacterium]|nr:hypothetical protein [Clostridiales bacterium]
LHTTSLDPETIIKDDGLRILRLVRFACDFQLTPSPSLLQCAITYVHLLKDIAKERLYQELEKILTSDLRYPNHVPGLFPVEKGLALLSQIGCFPYLFPSSNISCAGEKLAGTYVMEDQKLFPHRLCLLMWTNPCENIQKDLYTIRAPKKMVSLVLSLTKALQTFPSFPITQNSHPQVNWWMVSQGKEIVLQIPPLLRAIGLEEHACFLSFLIKEFDKNLLPWTIADMAVNGHSLLPFLKGASPRLIGTVIAALHREVVEEKLPNQKDALLCAGKKMIFNLTVAGD